jgi:hypothetical protein
VPRCQDEVNTDASLEQPRGSHGAIAPIVPVAHKDDHALAAADPQRLLGHGCASTCLQRGL